MFGWEIDHIPAQHVPQVETAQYEIMCIELHYGTQKLCIQTTGGMSQRCMDAKRV